MSAGVSKAHKAAEVTVNDFTRRPKIRYTGVAVVDGTVGEPNLHAAIDRITNSPDAQTAGSRAAPFHAKKAVFDRPTMLWNMVIETVRSTASLLLENCTVGTVESSKDLILTNCRVTKGTNAPFLYLVDSATKAMNNLRFLYSAQTEKVKDKPRWVLWGFSLDRIACSYQQISLVDTSVQGGIRFRRLEDSALVEDPNRKEGQVILKASTAIHDPAAVNGTIQRDTAYAANRAAADRAKAAAVERAKAADSKQAAPRPAEDDDEDDLDCMNGERLTYNLKPELVAAAEKAALAALPPRPHEDAKATAAPLAEREVVQVHSRARRCSCKQITAIAVGAIATVVGCGAAAWNYCFGNQSQSGTSGWFSMNSSGDADSEFCSYLRQYT